MNNFKLLKVACYTTNLSMSIISNLSPLLFLTFKTLYDVSYSLLGTLVLINFFTQLLVDLAFSFFSHKFNITLSVKIMPVLGALGLILFALAPIVFSGSIYLGLVIGTIIFSAASGLAEVLMSPLIAQIPAENPDHEMSKLHSVYAWGVVGVVIFATVFLLVFGNESWQILTLIFSIVPIISAVLFSMCKIPKMPTPEKTSGAVSFMRDKGVWACILAIFLGGAAECTMAQWASSYLEQAVGIPKIWGDIFGVAMFAAALGLGRSLYSKFGKHVTRVLVLGAFGAVLCYLIAVFSPVPVIGLIGCAFTGFCVSMLWPGNIIVASDRYPSGGVLIYALMASGGDLGASVGPQLVGVITDAVAANPTMISFAESLALMPEVLGMKVGMLVGMLFPLCALPLYISFHKKAIQSTKTEECIEK